MMLSDFVPCYVCAGGRSSVDVVRFVVRFRCLRLLWACALPPALGEARREVGWRAASDLGASGGFRLGNPMEREGDSEERAGNATPGGVGPIPAILHLPE